MHKIIYSSRAKYSFGTDELHQLVHAAQLCNDVTGLTGMLLYSQQSFLQLVEGNSEAVTETFDRIRADRRHTDVRVLTHREVSVRLFPGFAMGFEQIEAEDLVRQLPGYTTNFHYPLNHPELVLHDGVAEILITQRARHMATQPSSAPTIEALDAR